jgi:hypothetical protein
VAVIEVLTFRLAPGVDRATFLEADRRVQTEFAYHQPGLLRRTTAEGDDGGWLVLDLWRAACDADACDARWGQDPVTAGFMALVDRESVRTDRYSTLG